MSDSETDMGVDNGEYYVFGLFYDLFATSITEII